MATIEDAAGQCGLFTDGDWILSENMVADGTIGVIQLKHVGVGEFHYKEFQFISNSTFNELGCTEVRPGDVLISRMADPIGRACIVPRLPFRSVTAVDVSILRVDESVADRRFITHLCNSQLVRNRIARAARGTTRSRITRTELGEIEIPLPSLSEQRQIAERLERADRLRCTRRYSLELSNTLLSAAFLELFGDNSDGFPALTVDELAADKPHAIRTGPFGSQLLHSEFTERGIAVLGIDNAVNNEFAWDQRRFITPEKYEQLKRYTVFPGDVIITIMGTCGRCAIVPDNIPTAINTKHLCCVTLDQDRCLPIYLYGAFLFDPFVSRQRRLAMKGAIMDGLNMEIIKGLRIPLPPLLLQQKFAGLVERVERLRAVQREALRQAEHLFASLLDRAFSD
jgi:type I restriction enzyme S subunit